MYEGGKGACGAVCTGSGAAALPNTGGNTLLTLVAITAITVGAAITISTLVRAAAKRAYKA